MTTLAVPTSATGRSGPTGDLDGRLVARGIDLALVLALVLVTLNSSGSWGFIASPTTKAAACLIAVFAAVHLLLVGPARPASRALVGTVLLYGFVIALTSLARQLPGERYVLLGEQITLTVAVVAWMCVRPARLLAVLFTTSVIHLVMAVVIPDRFLMEDGVYRLDGGSHPIQLGFEAGAVLVVSIVAAASTTRTRARVALALLAAFSAVVIAQAFSRQSLIAVSVSIVVLTLVIPGAFRIVRAFLGVVGAALVVISLGGQGIASLLGADNVSQLSSATGRTTIWARVLVLLPQYVPFGFGYAALNDAIGPDRAVFAASFGETAENAPLQVLLDGGIPGVVCWVLVLAVAATCIWRARGASQALALAVLPLFVSSLLVSSGLSGEGLQWWWFLAVVAECAVSSTRLRVRGGAVVAA